MLSIQVSSPDSAMHIPEELAGNAKPTWTSEKSWFSASGITYLALYLVKKGGLLNYRSEGWPSTPAPAMVSALRELI